jgi:hypothetical protein
MATIDLGKIAFVNKGTYNNSTTYEKNDLVQFTDGGLLSTYLYIDSTAQSGQAPSSSGTAGSRWVYFAKGGAAGTDLTTTLTTQGDLVYRDGSGLQRLGAGTSGQVLQTGGTGANPSWVDASGGAFAQFQYRTVISNEYTNSNSGAYVEATNHYVDITPSSNSASTKILVNLIPHVYYERGSTDVGFQYEIHRTVGGTTTTLLTSSSVQFYYNGSNNIRFPSPIWYMDTPQTTSSVRYSFRFKNPHGSSPIYVGGGGSIQNHHMAWELN